MFQYIFACRLKLYRCVDESVFVFHQPKTKHRLQTTVVQYTAMYVELPIYAYALICFECNIIECNDRIMFIAAFVELIFILAI